MVTLLDVNDNTPQFSVANDLVSLPESAEVERIILVVGAEDLDEGSNAEITYDIIGGNDQGIILQYGYVLVHVRISKTAIVIALYSVQNRVKKSCILYVHIHYSIFNLYAGTFEIFQDGTIRTVLALDYETVTLYNLTIAAIDGGSPPLTGTTAITVDITDVNDNAPQFNEKQNDVTVSENTAVGTVIAVIEATDADGDENGNINYRIITASNTEEFFSIDEATGSLMIAKELDRETTATHLVSTFYYFQNYYYSTAILAIILSLGHKKYAPTTTFKT